MEYFQGMTETARAEDFPFMAELPKREKSKLAKGWELFRELQKTVEEKGFLVPANFASEILGVSKQRVHFLIKENRLETIVIQGHNYITEDSLVEFARSERKSGRPLNIVSTPKEAMERAKNILKK
jgi:hypothetical protein